ncbi:hypothetical protein [Streptomyces ipomoeae]|uniref:hypothetical protein n=1 Tax=Streptomyces ipomoeae TaxID=103232 RepID=UPI001FD14C39|nr:hypothetical protein [Streptomyces ipomoeae]MDX2937124.1 hypothetical protein [Streptomyces ipomoeae]
MSRTGVGAAGLRGAACHQAAADQGHGVDAARGVGNGGGHGVVDGGDGARRFAAERDGLGALAHLSYVRRGDTDRFGTDEQLTRSGLRNGGGRVAARGPDIG